MRAMMSVLSCTGVLIGIVLLMAACTNTPPEATATADQFIRAYFAEDNVAGAAKLASGAAKARLDGVLQQIEATGLKEPSKDKPRVKVTSGANAVRVGGCGRLCLSYRFRDARHSADHRETAAQQGRQCLERERIRAESVTPPLDSVAATAPHRPSETRLGLHPARGDSGSRPEAVSGPVTCRRARAVYYAGLADQVIVCLIFRHYLPRFQTI